MLPVSLDCSFFIAPSVFSNIYSLISSKIYTGGVILRNNFDENGKTEKVISLKELQKFQLKKLDNDPFWKNKFEDVKR